MAGPSTNEIDLLALLLKAVRIVRDNFWVILIFFIIGAGVGFAYYYSSTKVYETRMVISSEIMTESYSKQMVSSLNQFLTEGNVKALAQQLSIPESVAGEIAYISIKSPYANENEIGKEIDRKYFVVTVEVLNLAILDQLQESLIHYFENNEYVKIRVEQNKKSYNQLIERSEQEIRDLEALKEKINKGDLFQSAKGGVAFDLTQINSKILEITKDKLKLQNDLELVNSVHVIDGFKRFEKPVRPKFGLTLIAGSMVGILFVALFIAFKSVRKLLRMEEESRKAA